MVGEFKSEWDKSYKNKDNYIFYPHEEIIRFISKYIRKRVGLDEFIDQCEINESTKVLDFGCGIGRHMRLLYEFGLNARGFDLSSEAITVAKNNFSSLGMGEVSKKLDVANITNLPYESGEFDFMLSHGVIDSMPIEVAQKGFLELYRTLKKGGYIFFDVIGVDDPSLSNTREDSKYRIVTESHEQGTVQSYFDLDIVHNLLGKMFEVVEFYNIKKYCKLQKTLASRYYVIAKKI
jgi:SAM-dependent methyltransferase